MYSISNINTQNNNLFASFKLNDAHGTATNSKPNSGYRVRTYNREISNADKTKAFLGSAIGTALPLLLMIKKQKIKNPLKLKYGMWDMVGVSASSIAGGVSFGLINEEKSVQKNRLKEGFFQFLNAAIPTWVVGGAISLCENSEKHNTKTFKFLSVIGGLLVGMYGSAAIANLITDPKDKYPDRKLTPKDALANIDDGIGALALAKIPRLDKLNISGILPLIYTACGYRAGKSN